MSLHLQKDLDQLKQDILELGSMVETSIDNSLLALAEGRVNLAEIVIEAEEWINKKEVFIEDCCLKILALHQPVAVDLRFIVVVLKVNNDLERMGDLAINIAKQAEFLSGEEPIAWPPEFSNFMFKTVRAMVKSSLDALVKLDVNLAYGVIAMDDSVDDIHRNMYAEMQVLMKNDAAKVERAVSLISTSRYLERIADMATNIAEEVIFVVDGVVIRHQDNASNEL